MGIQRKKILRRREGQVKMPHAGVHLAYLKRAKNSVWLGKDCKCEKKGDAGGLLERDFGGR